MRHDHVDNTPFRQLALRRVAEGSSWSDLARNAGYLNQSGAADTTWLKRQLGLLAESDSRNRRRSIRYETGVRLCRALNADPVDLGV